jgi:hypothetical protein
MGAEPLHVALKWEATAHRGIRRTVRVTAGERPADNPSEEHPVNTTARPFGCPSCNLTEAPSSVAQLQETQRELIEMEQRYDEAERRYFDMGERYYRERQYRVKVAAIARMAIARTHVESHAGSVETCETCAADWVAVQEASGVTAPAF